MRCTSASSFELFWFGVREFPESGNSGNSKWRRGLLAKKLKWLRNKTMDWVKDNNDAFKEAKTKKKENSAS